MDIAGVLLVHSMWAPFCLGRVFDGGEAVCEQRIWHCLAATIFSSRAAIVPSVAAVVRASCVIGSEIGGSPSLGGRALVDIPATGR